MEKGEIAQNEQFHLSPRFLCNLYLIIATFHKDLYYRHTEIMACLGKVKMFSPQNNQIQEFNHRLEKVIFTLLSSRGRSWKKLITRITIFVAFVEDNVTMSSIRCFENRLSHFVQNRRK